MSPVLEFDDVSFVRDGRAILRHVTWEVSEDERWVVLGRNGSGKTTLVRIAALYEHPSSGALTVLGESLGSTDVRRLRQRIGFSSAAFLDMLRPSLTAAEVVMCARHGALEPWWHTYTDTDRADALEALDSVGIAELAQRRIATLSSGERQRLQLARVAMNRPGLVIVDEPSAGLDLTGREQLVGDLDAFAARSSVPVILVTHHVEEIPPSFTHVAMIRDGEIVTAGPIDDELTAEALGECFGMALSLERCDQRFTAWARPGPSSRTARDGVDRPA